MARFILAGIFTILGLMFYLLPDLDLVTSGLFYKPDGGFYLSGNIIVRILHDIVPVICGFFVLGATLYCLKVFLRTKSFHPKYYIKVIYVTCVCLLGPGLIIHAGFKEVFDRARPHQVTEFGGNAKFTPAFVITDQCATNCSFVSGHASVGFMFYALAFLFTGKRKMHMTIFATLLGLILGITRIIEGGHFLSDVIFSGIIVYITAYFLYLLLKPNKLI